MSPRCVSEGPIRTSSIHRGIVRESSVDDNADARTEGEDAGESLRLGAAPGRPDQSSRKGRSTGS
jgi:hypothetical protein